MAKQKGNAQSHNVHSNQMHELIGKPPHWFLAVGPIVTISLLFIGILILSIVRFPKTIDADVIVVVRSGPDTLICNQSGIIQKLLVKEKDIVIAQQNLVVLQNLADYDSILVLEKNIAAFDFLAFIKSPSSYTLHFMGGLGELQKPYEHLLSSYENYLLVSDDSSFDNKMIEIKKCIGNRQQTLGDLDKRMQQKRDQSNFETKNAGSANDDKKNINQEITNCAQLFKFMEPEIIDRINMFSRTKLNATNHLRSDLEILKNSMRQWQEKFILKSNSSGIISFSKSLTEGQQIDKMDPILSILQVNVDAYAIALIPSNKSFEVLEGQKAIIKLNEFPYLDYGVLRGTVEGVSRFPNSGICHARIRLQQGLITTYKKEIVPSMDMAGNARIVISNDRLISKIFNSIIPSKHK